MAEGAAIISVISAVVSLAITLSAKQPQVPGMKDSGVKLDRRGRDDPKLVAFGDTIVPMSSVYSNVNDAQNEWLTQLFNICVGPVKSVNQLYCNGVRYFPNSETNKVGWHKAGLSNEFPNVALGVKTGKMVEDAMFLPITQNSDGEVDASFRGDRCATMSLLAEKWINKTGDNDIRFMHPENKWEALVSGLSVIDPRLDPSCLGKEDVSKRVWGTSYRNPACCILTYLLDPYFGMNYDVDEINIASFAILANYCDAQGLTFDGFINQDQTKGEIMADFAKSFDGDIYYEDGEICARARTKSLPVIHIDENVMNKEGFKYSPKGAADYCNVVKIEYINFDNNQSQDSYVIPKNHKLDPVIARDGEVKEKTIKLPFLVDGKNGNLDKVKFYANREYKRAQLVKKTVSFVVNNIDVQLKMNDVFTFSNKALRLENLKFRVTSIKNTMDEKLLETKIEAEEYVDEIYDAGEYVDGGNSGNMKPPTNIIYPPRNIVFIQNTGMGVGSGNLQWESVYKGERRSVVEYRKTGATEWVKYGSFLVDSCVISGLQTGISYDFRIRTQAVIGMSSWAYLNNQMIKRNLVLPAIQNITGDFTTGNLILKWDPVNQPVDNKNNPNSSATNLSEYVAYYRVEISHDTKGNLKKIINASTPEATYTVDENLLNGGSRRLYVSVTAISVFGDEGNVSGQIEFYNEPMGQPSSVLVESQLVNLTVSWLNPSNLVSDYDSTDIWITDTKVSPTAADFVATSDIGSWTAVRQSGKKKGWVYVAHRDVFGHPAIPVYSAPIYFEETTIDDLITDSAFEGQFKDLQDSVNQIDTELTELGKEVDTNKVEVDDALTNQQNQINAEKDRLNGTIADLAETEAGLNQAKLDILKNATDIKTNKTELTSQGARLTTVEQVASDNTGSIATVSQRVEAVNKDLSAKIETNRQSIVTTNAAMASMETRLKADIGKNTAAITQTNKTVATLDSTVASMDTRLTAKIDKNTADISTVQQSVADTNGSMASMETKLQAQIDTNKAGIASNKTAIAATDKNLAEYKLTVSTEFGKINGRVDTVSSSVSTLEKTVTTQGQTITANYNDLNGKIQTNSTAIVNANKAITSLDTKLSAQIKGVDDKANGIRADVTQQGLAIAATDKALTEFKTSTNAQFGTVNSRIDTLQTNLATTDKALASLDTKLQTQINTNKAGIAENKTAIVTTNSAMASMNTSLQAQIDGNKASIQTISQAQVGTDGKVSAIYGLKVDANGKVAGMTLGATDKGSTVDFLTDTFRIASSTNGTPVTAFEVRNGTTYIRNAMIGDLTSQQIRTGSLTGENFNASSYIAVGSGKTSCTMNGKDPTFRLYAGDDIPWQAPFRVTTDGTMIATKAIITGTITATSGSFTGSITATSGSFTGAIYCANGAYVSGHNQHHFLYGANGRFIVDQAGNMTCQYAVINGGQFNGTVSVDNLVGDVVKSGFVDYPHIPPSQKFISGGSEFPFLSFTFPVTSYKQILHLAKISFLLTNGGNANYADLYWKFSNGSTIQLQRANSTSGGQPYDFKLDQLDNQFIEIPIGVSWVQLVVKPYTGSYISRPFASKSLWQSWKQGTGGIGVAVV
ncbi:TPA: DUF1983 domain-containing protein [Aeromonas dhakensis]|uniref:phage tail tip fiber protein n=1 Tax=Aeromonas dhakensis TaxID=196024 RepID=UPI002891BA1A|nr:DUF1983 domain-containing protein [Aeromonas dhakensis]HDX8469037.1 DUF1983 domain-containing protein [Aeromonas dhakensis]HDZ8869552.1 DUF1983 domain-containing protein [Aeromonas dhakensis]HDZ8931172.1 DUF1983 domain-containing protein [Aeromonas dhakensis]HEA3208378.1 DUF1983 domain-containing protein [Aeromonas dhakensis]